VWPFTGAHDDGAVVRINGAKVYEVGDVSDVNWIQSRNVTPTAGQASLTCRRCNRTGRRRRTSDGNGELHRTEGLR
jgi:hypothetical protein